MNIVVIGAGGVGGYFGGRLAAAGHKVSFLCRGKHLEAILENGLTVNSINGDLHLKDIKASDKISDFEKADLILVATKAWQVKEIAPELSQILRKETIVIPLQNGVLAAQELAEALPSQNIVNGLCRIISKIDSPGVIKHFGINPTIVVGEINKVKSDRLLEIQRFFTDADIKMNVSDDIEAELWKKFISICVSGLLAITRTTYGELRETPETREMMIGLLEEIYNLAIAKDVKIESDFVSKSVSFIDSFPYNSTSSLTRDVWDGKPSEIEYQNGTVVKFAKELGVKTPINEFVYNCILPMENKSRKK